MSEWKTTTWGELATLEYGKGLRGYKDADGPYRVYGTNGPIGWHTGFLYGHPSVIIGRKGAYRGVHYSDRPFYVIDTAFYLKPKMRVEFDIKWAYYEILTYDINGMDSGSAIPSTSRDDFYRLKVKVPPLPTQRRIAQILGRLDDKIEVNRRINRTLEAMAQALYRHHFVEFGPYQDGPFVDSELGSIPEGWGVVPLKQLVKIESISINPQKFPNEVFNYYSIPDHKNLSPSQDVGEEVKSNKYLITSNRVLVSKLNPRFYRIWTVYHRDDHRSFSSTEFINYVCKSSNTWTFINCYLRSQEFVTEFRSRVTGTTGSRQRVKPKETLSFQMVKPPSGVLDKFEKLVGPYFLRMEHTIEENRKLAEIRDYLLPRLLSGELEVTEAAR